MLTGHSLADPLGRLVAVDHQVCEIMHRSERELLGMSYKDLTHSDDRARNVSAIERLGRTGPATIRKRYIRPDGSVVQANVEISRLCGADAGKLIGTIKLVNTNELRSFPETIWQSARDADQQIRNRRVELGNDLFSDYPWLMLVGIYLSEAEGQVISISELTERVELRANVTERWLQVLSHMDLVEIYGTRLQLTDLGFKKVEILLDNSSLY